MPIKLIFLLVVRSTCFPTYLVLLKESILLIIIPMMVPCLDTCLIRRFTMAEQSKLAKIDISGFCTEEQLKQIREIEKK